MSPDGSGASVPCETSSVDRAEIVNQLRQLAYHGEIRRDQIFDLGRLAQRWIDSVETEADVNLTVAIVEASQEGEPEQMAG